MKGAGQAAFREMNTMIERFLRPAIENENTHYSRSLPGGFFSFFPLPRISLLSRSDTSSLFHLMSCHSLTIINLIVLFSFIDHFISFMYMIFFEGKAGDVVLRILFKRRFLHTSHTQLYPFQPDPFLGDFAIPHYHPCHGCTFIKILIYTMLLIFVILIKGRKGKQPRHKSGILRVSHF